MDDIVVLSEWIKSDAGACCKVLAQMPVNEDIYGPGAGIALRKGSDKLKSMFDEAIVAIRENGEYQKVQAKYFDFDVYGD